VAPPIDAFVQPRMDAFMPPPIDAFVPPAVDAFTPPPFDASGLTRGGTFVVEQDSGGGFVYIDAFFGAFTAADIMRGIYGPGCTILASSGSCRVITCTTGVSTDLAGTVRATSGSVTASTSMPTATAGSPPDQTYFAMVRGSIAAGQPVDLSVTGATVPPFAGRVTMPGPTDAVLPTTVSRSSDYVVQWTSTSSERVWAGIDLTSGDFPYIECDVPASAGSITIPAPLIAQFPAGASVIPYAANVDSVELAAGAYFVELQAWSYTQASPMSVAP